MLTTAHLAAGAAPLMTSAGARITAEVATWGHAKRAAAMQDVTALELQSLPQELLARIWESYIWESLVCARLARSFERHGAKHAEQEVLGRLLCTSRIFHGAVKDVLQSRAVALGQEVERLPTPELNFDERHIRTLEIAALGQLTMALHEAIQDAVTQDLEGLLTLKVGDAGRQSSAFQNAQKNEAGEGTYGLLQPPRHVARYDRVLSPQALGVQ